MKNTSYIRFFILIKQIITKYIIIFILNEMNYQIHQEKVNDHNNLKMEGVYSNTTEEAFMWHAISCSSSIVLMKNAHGTKKYGAAVIIH